MYYEERIIAGVLCYRNSPDSEWYTVEGGKSKLTQTQTHSAGAIRAAEKIRASLYWNDIPRAFESIIDAETHAAEMQAFIEKVAAWEFDETHAAEMLAFIGNVQREAFALLQKVG